MLGLVAGCSLALLVAAGAGAAFAHGEGHGRCTDCGSSKWHGGGSWSHSGKWHHHHHYPIVTGTRPPLHGPGSSHNPIIYHPVHGPGSSHNPIIVSKPGNGLAPGTVVRDHRNGKDCWYIVGSGGVITTSTCPHGGGRH